jgi:DNA-binding NarL/FixJ family response regulator
MKSRRIFILSPHTLMARGVGTLLQGQRGLRVVGTETDPTQGIRRIETLRPDVVITESESRGAPSLAVVSAVFEASPGTVVIGLSVGDNLLHVYQGNRIMVGEVADLIQAVKQAGGNNSRRKQDE